MPLTPLEQSLTMARTAPITAADPDHANRMCALGRAVLETEAQAVLALATRLDADFARACDFLLSCRGRIVVLGMGKSGHIAGKIAATLASTGTPAFFVHPGEAGHGDLGMITGQDVVLALSHSGDSAEILTILPMLKRLGIPLRRALPFVVTADHTPGRLGDAIDLRQRIEARDQLDLFAIAESARTGEV